MLSLRGNVEGGNVVLYGHGKMASTRDVHPSLNFSHAFLDRLSDGGPRRCLFLLDFT